VRRRRIVADPDFWPGFTDVLSGMLLTMVFVMTLFAITQAGLVHVVGGKDAALRALEDQLAELRTLLGASDERAQTLERELLAATELVAEFGVQQAASSAEVESARAGLAKGEARIAELVVQLRAYLELVKELNARLTTAHEVSENRRLTLAELQLAMNRLRQQLVQMSERLTATEAEAVRKGLRLSELLAEMARKDDRIQELERLERYTSEFLAKMSEVFADNPNVRVVGDRFVFQSEVLFESGSDEIGAPGQRELDRFVAAFRALIPRIPTDLNVNVQVQGHTDTDQIMSSDRFASNWHLSSARALRVVEYLAAGGLPEQMLSAAGFGEHAPRVIGRSPEAKAVNRRIEIRITRR